MMALHYLTYYSQYHFLGEEICFEGIYAFSDCFGATTILLDPVQIENVEPS